MSNDWTSTPPAVAGWYGHRNVPDNGIWYIVYYDGIRIHDVFGNSLPPAEYAKLGGGEWSGPLPPPGTPVLKWRQGGARPDAVRPKDGEGVIFRAALRSIERYYQALWKEASTTMELKLGEPYGWEAVDVWLPLAELAATVPGKGGAT